MREKSPILSAAVVGVGYLGKFHAQKYAQIEDTDLVAVVDVDPNRAAELARALKTEPLSDYLGLLGQVDMVSIASPTKAHYEIARNFLRHGTHVLVEKPITSSIDEANELISIARDKQLVLQVGHLERFNAALIGIQHQLKDPEFIESHRLAPFNPRGTDVNVVLDLMIHDIDIILTIVGSEVDRIDAKGTRVLSDATDLANARIAFKNGCVANVTASRVSLKSERKMRLFQQDRCFTVDFQNRAVKIYHKGVKEIFPGVPEIVTDETRFAESDAILAETRAFIDAVRSGSAPLVSGEDGKRALQTAIRITELLSN